jgi:NhaP-type Na+/H+ or K+/H+ antiporter
MEVINPYTAIIALSLIIIISYFFNVISKRTNIPSVLMLIALGLLLKQGLNFLNISAGDSLFDILEVLGIIGLIMIVLEAALDLKLSKEKWPIIWKSFSVALITLVLTTFGSAYILQYFIIDDFFHAIT